MLKKRYTSLSERETKHVTSQWRKLPRQLLGLSTVSLIAASLLTLMPGCGSPKAVTLKDVQKQGKLVAGVKFDSKPFGYLGTDGELRGYDIALMRELAKRLLGSPDKIEFQQVLSSTRVIALNAGNVDLVGATMTITPERQKVVDFSIPYYTAHQAVIVPNGSKINTLDDLNGHTILFVLGSTSEMHIKKRLPHAKYVGFKSMTDAFSALKAKRGDAMTTDDSIIYGLLADNCNYHMLSERLSDEPYGLAFRKGEGKVGETLRDKVNQVLQEMQRDGSLEKLKTQWVEGALKNRPCKT